jgi:hypothetical protein
VEFAVIPALDGAFGAPLDDFLHPPPVFAVFYNILTNSQIFFESEVLPADVGAQVVEVSFPDLFGGEF